MKAIKITTTVGQDRTIHLQLPRETPEGVAEVIVLVSERSESTDADALLRIATQWRERSSKGRSKEEIDQALEEERSAWDS